MKDSRTEPLTFFEVITSILCAAIGVQTRARMERDLTQGELVKFIAAGVIFTLLFVLVMIAVVNLAPPG
ncbi:MAG: DUF2970 domain-containing protein [Pseudomonadota bacterium]